MFRQSGIRGRFQSRNSMNRQEIVQFAQTMKTKEDLLTLLNRIKMDEMIENGLVEHFRPFTMRHINYYCNPNHVFHRYCQFKIKKKTSGFRQITAPRNRSFMMLLQAVNELFKAHYTPSDYAMGFTKGRSVVDNASMHLGQNYVLNIDLQDFFPSIEQPRVWKRLQLPPFNFSREIASLLAGFCSMRKTRKDKEYGILDEYAYVLPQGAPTSPIITNMICDTLDRRLAGLAKRFGLRYSRYADDITFSSMHNVYHKDSEFWKELKRIIEEQHFTINPHKTRLQKRGGRQEVTGLIISEKVNVTRKYVREIRNLLFIWKQHGLSVAEARFVPKYKQEKGHVKKGNPNLVNVLSGKLLYLKMVKGEDDSVYQRLQSTFEALIRETFDSIKINSVGITYLETMPLRSFEQKNSTKISIVKTKGGRCANFILNDFSHSASVQTNITEEDEQKKDKLAISNCQDKTGKRFWLIHYKNKVTKHIPPVIDIDELNNDLDSLLNA